MDRPFISKMCTAYYNDFELYKEHIWPDKKTAVSELENFIIQEIDTVKFTNIKVYENVFKLSRDAQYRVIYNLLDEYIDERYSLDNTKRIEEFDFFTTIGSTIGGLLGGLSDTIISFIGAPAMAAISTFGVTFGSLLIMAIMFFGFKYITLAKAKLIVSFHLAIDELAKFVKKISLKSRLENSIIFSNLDTCGHTCGIHNFSDLDKFTSLALRGIQLTKTSKKQFDCLYKCFIETSFKLVDSCTKSYMQCLKSSGENISTESLSAVNIFLRPPSSAQCKIYYDQLKKFDKEFNEAISIIGDIETRDHFIKRYHQTLEIAIKSSSFTPRFDDKQHPKQFIRR